MQTWMSLSLSHPATWRRTMDHDNNEAVDLIDLGVASVETQGANEGQFDLAGLVIPQGLTND